LLYSLLSSIQPVRWQPPAAREALLVPQMEAAVSDREKIAASGQGRDYVNAIDTSESALA
jgi:hypothetical protein